MRMAKDRNGAVVQRLRLLYATLLSVDLANVMERMGYHWVPRSEHALINVQAPSQRSLDSIHAPLGFKEHSKVRQTVADDGVILSKKLLADSQRPLKRGLGIVESALDAECKAEDVKAPWQLGVRRAELLSRFVDRLLRNECRFRAFAGPNELKHSTIQLLQLAIALSSTRSGEQHRSYQHQHP
jgi:hypothetical protein